MVMSQVWPVPQSVSRVQCAPEEQQPLASQTWPGWQSASLLQPHEPPGTQTPVVTSQVPLAQSASLAQGGTPVTHVWVLGSHISPVPQSEAVSHLVPCPSTITLPPQAAQARASIRVEAKERARDIGGASKERKGMAVRGGMVSRSGPVASVARAAHQA